MYQYTQVDQKMVGKCSHGKELSEKGQCYGTTNLDNRMLKHLQSIQQNQKFNHESQEKVESGIGNY